MAKLRKDDPIYYKQALTNLIKEAKANGLIVFEEKGSISFKYVIAEETELLPEIYEQASVNINDV